MSCESVHDKKHMLQRFDITTTVIYVGHAYAGTLSSQARWTIKKITLSSGVPTAAQWSEHLAAVWDNRATEVYK